MSTPSSSTLKRSSFQAQLEQDASLSSARRKERSQTFTSQMAQSSIERKLLVAQEAQRKLEEQLREKDMQIDRLENDRRFLAEREQEEKSEKEREREAREQEKARDESAIRTMRTQLLHLQGEHDDLKDSHASLQRSTSLTTSNYKTQTQTLQHQISMLQSELASFQEQARRSESTARDLRGQLEDLSLSSQGNKSFEAPEQQQRDWEIVRDELKRQASHLRTLESSNAKLTGELVVLKQRAGNAEVLREEKRALEGKLAGVEKLRSRCGELEREVDMLKREKEAIASTSQPSTSHSDQSRELTTLRLQHANLLDKLGATSSELRLKESQVNELNAGLDKVRKAMEVTKKNFGELEMRALHAERRLEIEKRESGFLKAMVTSFEAEKSMVDQTAENPGDISLSMIDERVASLQDSIDELKALNLQLERQLEEAYKTGNPERIAAEEKYRHEVESTISTLRKSESSQLDKIEELEQTLFELRGDIAAGSHVPPNTRILQLKDNPATQWENMRKEVLERLKKENEALLRRLSKGAGKENRGAEGESGGDSVPRESWIRLEKEKEALEEVVKQGEKRLLRLQQVFTAKSSEFREAISSILGFKLAFYPNGQVRVTSQYDLSATFVFQPADSEIKMKLVGQGEGGPEDLPQLLRYWVEGEMCIPGFMASVTLECYEKMRRTLGRG